MERTASASGVRRFFAAVCMLAALAVGLGAAHTALNAPESEGVVLRSLGTPEAAVTRFFNAACRGAWEEASSWLDGEPTLDLSVPADGETARIWDAFLASWSWNAGEVRQEDALHAWEEVYFTSLSVERLFSGLREEVQASLVRQVEEATFESDIYEEDGGYKEEIIRRTLEEILADRLARGEEYTVTRTLRINLRYTESGWRLLPEEALLEALSGSGAEAAE